MRTARKSLEVSRTVHCLWREPDAHKGYAAAVSLHSHTLHSRESLDFVPRALRGVPVAQAALERLEAHHCRMKGRPIPFARAFWRPPLNPRAAHHLEASQVERLGLRPLLSLTDHDTLEACTELHAIGIQVPYSVEWTVPYRGTVFHIGVHDLPPDQARALEAGMNEATAAPTHERVAALLAAMHGLEDVLLVLNHPFSCEMMVARAQHERLLASFLEEFGEWMHAYELNGLQPASNNIDTLKLAAARSKPVISGGDRHCLEPNANLNLTHAATFAEFVNEIRVERRSTVLFLPQYHDPIPCRYIEFIWQAVRNYPEFPGRVRWADRVYITQDDGESPSFQSLHPDGAPAVINGFISVIGFLARPGIRAVLSRAVGRGAELEPEAL